MNADGRGHYERELLINEEDLHRKFTKWSLRTAKSDTLSVEAARDWLNKHILGTLPADVLSSYGLGNKILLSTACRWMQVARQYCRGIIGGGCFVVGFNAPDSPRALARSPHPQVCEI